METTETQLQIEQDKTAGKGPQPSGNTPLFQMLLIAILTLALSVTLSLILARSLVRQKSIVVLDVNKIFEAKKKQFTDSYKGKDITPETKVSMQRDIDVFNDKFNAAVQNESRDHIIFYRESVVSTDTVPDITDCVMSEVK
jgi:hypothetical protein